MIGLHQPLMRRRPGRHLKSTPQKRAEDIRTVWKFDVPFGHAMANVCESINREIIVPAQNALHVECGASRGVSISCARRQHTQGPVVCSTATCHAIDSDVLNVMTTWLLPDFSQCAPT
jgi:hypothetical protein